MNPSKRPAVTIPLTPLGAELAEAAQIQREMTQLLRELEQTAGLSSDAAGQPVTKPGAWRHRPT
jgi:hypothetical protein